MAKDIWVISDTHFLHSNILTFKDSDDRLIRGSRFSSVEEMDDYMIEMWNSVVKPSDKVYHCGDVFIGDKEKFKTLWPKLNGKKNLILGNHDDAKFLASGGFFNKIQMWRIFSEFGLILSHTPLHECNLLRLTNKSGKYPDDCEMFKNCHGHIHQNPSPDGNYHNVCVEMINYTPVNIEDLRIK